MTELLIFSPYRLHRDAWKALLASQPGIQFSAVLDEVSQIDPRQVSIPAAILVDLPSLNVRAVREIHERAPQAGLLILISSYGVDEVIDLLQAGATGLISRQAATGDLARAIIAVGRGEVFLPPEIAVQSLMALAHRQTASHGFSGMPSAGNLSGRDLGQDTHLVDRLSVRETEVLNLLAQGMTNKDIAQAMVISVRTVEAHLRSIFGKLAIRSRTEAVLWAVRNGYGVHPG